MTLREISPPLGLVTGGTPVNVFGSFIPPGNLFCGFGDELVPVSSERVFCAGPNIVAGAMELKLRL